MKNEQIKVWTDIELLELKNIHNNMDDFKLARHFNTTIKQLKNKKLELNLYRGGTKQTRYTPTEDKFILDNYYIKSPKEIGIILKRNTTAIKVRFKTLTGIKNKPSLLWNKHELKFLKDNFNTLSYIELSKHLNRTFTSIKAKANKMGLYHRICHSSHLKWTDADNTYLKTNYKTQSKKKLGEILNRSIDSIQYQLRLLELTNPPIKLPNRIYKSDHPELTVSKINKINYKKYYPERARVHYIIKSLFKKKKITKQPCIICGSTTYIHAHHNNYNFPLQITWLCPKCHHDWHNINKPIPHVNESIRAWNEILKKYPELQ